MKLDKGPNCNFVDDNVHIVVLLGADHGGFLADSESTKEYAGVCRKLAIKYPELHLIDLYEDISSAKVFLICYY